MIDARVALRTGVQLLAGGARVSWRLSLKPGRWRRRGVVILKGFWNLRSGREVQQIIGAHCGVLFAAAIQALRIPATTHAGIVTGGRHIATVGIGTVLCGRATVPASGGHQGAAVLNRTARRSRTAGHFPLTLSLVAGLAAMRIVTGTAAGVTVYRGLAGGLDRSIATAAAAQNLAVRRVSAYLGVQIRERLVAIDVEVAGGIGRTAILARVGNLMRVRVRTLVVVSVRW